MRMKNCGLGRLASTWLCAKRLSGWVGLVVVALAAGCAHSPADATGGGLAAPLVPQPPVFLSGAMGLLFTNVDGFRARVVLEEGASAMQVAAGELMGQGGKLVFIPSVSKAELKRSLAADSAFIWEVPAHRGCIVNGPMQAYATIAANSLFTNLVAGTTAGGSPTEEIAGHPCQRMETVVTANDGSITAFRLWRATDLKGLALRVVCTSSSTPLTLNLSKARLETLPDDLFLPPGGFTKFESPQALAGELTTRQQRLKKRPSYNAEESEPGAGLDTRYPNRLQ
ncbi:MAG TPA: hypothetical protein PLC99_04860 [Verrucomicrobiota bacterium]|nr:hypothetical protein [Verrucomicrobiota bacterium]